LSVFSHLCVYSPPSPLLTQTSRSYSNAALFPQMAHVAAPTATLLKIQCPVNAALQSATAARRLRTVALVARQHSALVHPQSQCAASRMARRAVPARTVPARTVLAAQLADTMAEVAAIVARDGKSIAHIPCSTGIDANRSEKSFSSGSGCETTNIASSDGTYGAKAVLTCFGGPFDGHCCSATGYCGILMITADMMLGKYLISFHEICTSH
jgi:hypothetical protein